ncbi:MAG: DHH family phosphoesterase, partial [Clostridiales bacterium]|nr:DHH family phosphoesterase [Clostridiales bacterium]
LLFLSEEGRIIWYNKHFSELIPKKESVTSAVREIYDFRIVDKLIEGKTEISSHVEIHGRQYKMLGNILKMDSLGRNHFSIMLYFIETTEQERLKITHEKSRTAIGHIVIDNYEEINQSGGSIVINQILVEMDTILGEWIKESGGLVTRLSRERYLLMATKDQLQFLEMNKFSILDMAKKIDVGNKIPITLSIGISVNEDSIENNYKAALSAADLAMARGGDQAVVRDKGKDTYYGGSNIEIERRTKVKARVTANLLKKLIEGSSRVLIMGHQNCDMDSLGSALAVYRASVMCKKKARIVLNDSNPSIEVMLNELDNKPEYSEIFINSSHALNFVDENTLVVVVDTHRKVLTECPKLLDYASKVAVIDHHRRKADFIDNTMLSYQETYASSTSELLTEILMYFTKNPVLPLIEAEALYVGIVVDTKNFNFKTGTRTFEAASFLKSQGVDTVAVRKYFQPDYETFNTVCEITMNANLINNNIAISYCPQNIKNSQFISALAADQMLAVSGIDASFVLCQVNNIINISGRSLGDINVQVILEALGGGGHLTSAGAQMEDVSIEYAEKTLEKAIEDYLRK